jgi:hypothetical protein
VSPFLLVLGPEEFAGPPPAVLTPVGRRADARWATTVPVRAGADWRWASARSGRNVLAVYLAAIGPEPFLDPPVVVLAQVGASRRALWSAGSAVGASQVLSWKIPAAPYLPPYLGLAFGPEAGENSALFGTPVGVSARAAWAVRTAAGRGVNCEWAAAVLRVGATFDARWSFTQPVLAGGDFRWEGLARAGLGARLRWAADAGPGSSSIVVTLSTSKTTTVQEDSDAVTYRMTLTEPDGDPVDLSGADEVVAVLRGPGGAGTQVTLTVLDAAAGLVSLTLPDGYFPTPGRWKVQPRVVWGEDDYYNAPFKVRVKANP